DAWFAGYTPKLTAAVWMGYPEGNVRKMTDVRGRKVTGGSFPATIFRRFMTAGRDQVAAASFSAPVLGAGRPLKAPEKGIVFPTTTTTTTVPPPTTTAPTSPGPARAEPATTTVAPSATVLAPTTTAPSLLGQLGFP
ncbi:MAG: hypothetical protein ACRD0F_04090, partial [Acidimicrobiales bacterium]